MRTALVILWFVALAQTAFADTTPPPQAPPVRAKVAPPQAPPLVAAEVRVTAPYGPTDPANTELTLQGAVAEAQKRWGTSGTAWANPRDLAGAVWLNVGTFDPAVSKYWIYGRGLSWSQAFRDAELNGWPEGKRAGAQGAQGERGAQTPQAPQAPITTTQEARAEAKRRWGDAGDAWMIYADQPHCVGITVDGLSVRQVYGRGNSWAAAFADADRRSELRMSPAKICPCSPDCTCGCNEGRACGCNKLNLAIPVPVPASVSVSFAAPPMFIQVARGSC